MTEPQNKPLITVVTVVYNDVAHIEQTMLSVLNQTYPNIEYIIIDGGSTDGTVDVIKKYADRLAYWVSEPDKGIYDAMNKGIDKAIGIYIEFLNSGDYYYKRDSIMSLFSHESLIDSPDILYGIQIHSFEYGKYVRRPLALSNFPKFMPIGHPSSFVRTDLMKNSHFDCTYHIAADYDFFLKQYYANRKFKFVETLVVDFESEEGVSSASVIPVLRETAIVNGTYGTWHYKRTIFLAYVGLFVKNIIQIISPNLVKAIQLKKRKTNPEYISLEKYLSHENA